MCFILVLATVLLNIVGPGDMSGAVLVMVLVSEKSMHSTYWLHQHSGNLEATFKGNQKTEAHPPLPLGNATLIRDEFNYDMHIKEIYS